MTAHRADIYSLGMVMLELSGSHRHGSLRNAVDSEPRSKPRWRTPRDKRVHPQVRSRGWGAIAPGLRAILERCLDPDPARRYQRGVRAGRRPRPLAHRPAACLYVRAVLGPDRPSAITTAEAGGLHGGRVAGRHRDLDCRRAPQFASDVASDRLAQAGPDLGRPRGACRQVSAAERRSQAGTRWLPRRDRRPCA